MKSLSDALNNHPDEVKKTADALIELAANNGKSIDVTVVSLMLATSTALAAFIALGAPERRDSARFNSVMAFARLLDINLDNADAAIEELGLRR